MSNAAANGGDATSTGREGLQQVRLAKLLPKNWAVRVLAYSGRPVFLARVHERGARAKIPRIFLWGCDLVRPNAPVPSELPTQINQAGLLRHGVATLLPRLGVTPRGGNAADGGV